MAMTPEVQSWLMFCFTIQPGQFVGVVGPTGIGKIDSIASLIPRFYNPTAGRVLIDGADIADLEAVATLRTQFGYVLQETVLFRGRSRREYSLRTSRCG